MMKKVLSSEEALRFYAALVSDIREMYGTDDPKVLKKIALESDDLWLEEHLHDIEMYYKLLKKIKNNQASL